VGSTWIESRSRGCGRGVLEFLWEEQEGATVTKKVRKVKEEMVDLFPRPVFSSQIPPPPRGELFPYLALLWGSR